MGSDHDAVALLLPSQGDTQFRSRGSPTSPRALRPAYRQQIPELRTEMTYEWIQRISAGITEVRKRKVGFQESQDLKLLRRRALQAVSPRRAKELWKEVWKTRKLEKRGYDKDLASKAIQRDWEALREIRTRPMRLWQSTLISRQDWETEVVVHFEGIFARDNGPERNRLLGELRFRLLYMCKRTPIVLFGVEEIEAVAVTWKRGKSTGPDRVPYEAMKGIMSDGEHWIHRVAAMYSDALYKGQLPNASDSITTLLAKTAVPQSWGDTRPISLSCTALKILAQLLYCSGHNVIWLILPGCNGRRKENKLVRSFSQLDWGKPVYVLKLDIRKAFDTVVQARLGELLFRRLAVEGGKPWEARLWLQLVQCETLLVQTDGGNIPVQQTNGVRQGSPDSPVLFAALMGESIGDILARREEGDTSLPFSGSMYMDDTYLSGLNPSPSCNNR